MTEKLSKEELDAQTGADLPDKEAMSVLDTVGGLTDGGLLNLDVDLALDADVAAPIDAAVAANANVAAPIDAAVAANVASVGSTAQAVADQDSIIIQELDGTATATAEQTANVEQ
ncbi:MAG TPA: hypothetical protein VFU93_08150 [Acidimicrobiales bacterium]|nr:hypothetical protein [Acidimicrobiales bacterium]